MVILGGTSLTLTQFHPGGTCSDPNRRCRQKPARAGSAAGRAMLEQPLCQEGIPWFVFPPSPLLHAHTFRFYIKKRHKTHSFLGFS